MDNLIEIKEKAKKLQQEADALFASLTELQQASEKNPQGLDISNIMRRAAHSPLTGHPLTRCADSLGIEAYLVLLSAIAMTQVKADIENHPVLYPCRVAAVLADGKKAMEAYFRKALFLEEKTIHQYVETIADCQLEEAFILDAMLMTLLYDKGNTAKLEFIAELAALLNITEAHLAELVEMAKSIVEATSLNRKFTQLHMRLDDLRFYLKKCSGAEVVTPQAAFFYQNEDVWKRDFSELKGLAEVCFEDITLNGQNQKITETFSFSNFKKMTFQHCIFENLELNKSLFSFTCLEKVEFLHCVVRNFVISPVKTRHFGLLSSRTINPLFFTSSDVLQLSIQNSTFSNIDTSAHISAHILDDDRAIIGNSQGNTEGFFIGNTIFDKCGAGADSDYIMALKKLEIEKEAGFHICYLFICNISIEIENCKTISSLPISSD